MKKPVLLLLLSLTLLAAHAQGKKALSEEYGFRAMKFETRRSAYPGLVKIPHLVSELNKSRELYANPADELKIGGAALKYIHYEFYKGRLSLVLIETQASNGRALLEALRAQYGAGYQVTHFATSVTWDTDRVEMSCNLNRSSGAAFVRIQSKEVLKLEIREAVRKEGR